MAKQHPDQFFTFRLKHHYLGEHKYESFDQIPEHLRYEIEDYRPALIDCLPLTEEEAKPYLDREAVLPPYRVDSDADIIIEVKNKIPAVPFHSTNIEMNKK